MRPPFPSHHIPVQAVGGEHLLQGKRCDGSDAPQVFNEMKEHSRKDPQCTPNVISYSALMTACCSGGRPDKAHEVFQEMISHGIQPDQISYGTLIAGTLPALGSLETLLISPENDPNASVLGGGGPDRAHEESREISSYAIKRDQICVTLIAGTPPP